MSRHVYADFRTRQIRNANLIIEQAMSQLGAERSQISCGRADVTSSQFDVDAQAALAQQGRMQDSIDIRETGGLKADGSRDVADYSADIMLDDWKPAISAPKVHVQGGEVDSHGDRKLVEDLEVAAFDGARMMIFEVTGDDGEKSYEIGLDECLYDDDGNWKKDEHKDAYNAFLKQTLAAQRVAMADEAKSSPVSQQTNAALRLAGLTEKKSQKVPGGVTHRTVTNQKATEDAPKHMRVGGKNE